MQDYNPDILDKARIIFDYLYLQDKYENADAIIGFGHFDPKIPDQCADLYRMGIAPVIIFTGGKGAGSTGLVIPEALFFSKRVIEKYPNLKDDIIIETRSTNTGENLLFTLELLEVRAPGIKNNLRKILIVANAYRQRRVFLTCKKILPDVHFINVPPATGFEIEMNMYRENGENLVKNLISETDRLLEYPKRGFIAEPNMPEDVIEIYRELKKY